MQQGVTEFFYNDLTEHLADKKEQLDAIQSKRDKRLTPPVHTCRTKTQEQAQRQEAWATGLKAVV